jgi:purine-binding chemotaxis protein CheW
MNGTGKSQEYLTFMLGKEEYGVQILQVQEIRGWEEPTPMPEQPAFVKGVVNLRGKVVPIVDLRERFGLPVTYDDTTVVIVLNVKNTKGGTTVVGVTVDAVSEVYQLPKDQIQAAPTVVGAIGKEFIKGLVSVDKKMLILVDIEHLVKEGLVATN